MNKFRKRRLQIINNGWAKLSSVCLISILILSGCSGPTYLTLTSSSDCPNIDEMYSKTNRKMFMSSLKSTDLAISPEKIQVGSKECVFRLSITLDSAENRNIVFDPEDIQVFFYKKGTKIPMKVWNPVMYQTTALIKQKNNENFRKALTVLATGINAYNQSSALSKGDYSKALYVKNQQDDLNKASIQGKINDAKRRDNIQIDKEEFAFKTVLTNLPIMNFGDLIFGYQINGKIIISPMDGTTIDSDITAIEITIPLGDDIHKYKFDVSKYQN